MSATEAMIQPMALAGLLATRSAPTTAKAPNPTWRTASSGVLLGNPALRSIQLFATRPATYTPTTSHPAIRGRDEGHRRPSATWVLIFAPSRPPSLHLSRPASRGLYSTPAASPVRYEKRYGNTRRENAKAVADDRKGKASTRILSLPACGSPQSYRRPARPPASANRRGRSRTWDRPRPHRVGNRRASARSCPLRCRTRMGREFHGRRLCDLQLSAVLSHLGYPDGAVFGEREVGGQRYL